MNHNPRIGGILLKTSPENADSFVQNWRTWKRPQAFCIYDRIPVLCQGKPVFTYVSKRKHIGFTASYVRSEIVRAYKPLESDITRLREKERIWQEYHRHQLHTSTKEEFDRFWDKENGVRSLVFLEDIKIPGHRVPWKDIRRVIYTGYPRGVGYLYLLEEECRVLRELCHGVDHEKSLSDEESREDFETLEDEIALTCYGAALDLIPRILREGPLKTSDIYEVIRRTVPRLCDDNVRCIHNGKDYGQPEWRHQARSAQQALKRSGSIARDPVSRKWFRQE